MTDFTKDIETFYDKVGMEIRTLNKKDTLSRDEIKAGLDAICLMHKIKHFEDDGEKYGWNEDGYSQRGWTIREMPHYPDGRAYGMDGWTGANRMNGRNGSSNWYPANGNSYNDRYARDDLAQKIASLDERDRAAAYEFIERMR